METKNKEIKEYWTKKVSSYGNSHKSSWSDRYAIAMEIKAIASCLSDGDKVCDIGCNVGHSTMHFAKKKKIDILGLDYVEEMIVKAKQRLAKTDLGGSSVQFDVGDMTNLNLPDASFDKIVTTRVLINLGSWDNQVIGLSECFRVLRKGGFLLLSEASLNAWNRLNQIRGKCGFDAIPMPSFNNYLDEDKLLKASRQYADLIRVERFSSTYYLGTRVLKPLLKKHLFKSMDIANPKSMVNRLSCGLPAIGDFGPQKLFVFRKK